MKSYKELLDFFESHDIQNGIGVTKKKTPEEAINYFDLFDVLVWKLTIKDHSFLLLSSDFGYKNISTSDFKKFLQAIKPCFRDYFINYFKKYFHFLFKNKLLLCDYRLQSIIPIMLEKNQYYFCILSVVPIIENHRIKGFYFTLTPLKKYRDDFPSFNVLKDRKEDKLITYRLHRKVSVDNLLTKKQAEVFDLILQGYCTIKIAEHLNKKRETVFSYNVRIKERLTSFFEIDFDTVVDAAKYYKNCFLIN